MKNYPIVKSYVIGFEEFNELVKELFGEDFSVEYEFESVYIVDEEEALSFDKVAEVFSDYLNVEVSSIHSDENSVWVSFKG